MEGGILTVKDIEGATIAGYGFGGYGTIVKEVIEVIRYVARKEGIYLDPVYTGKAFFGLMDPGPWGVIPPGHGCFSSIRGLGGLFQYEDIISEMLP